MFRDLFINQWIIGSFGFLIVFSISCYFWYQHEFAPYKQETAETQYLLEVSQKAADVPHTNSIKGAPANRTAKATNTTSENTDDSKSQKSASLEKTSADVPVSPFGFGPYPPLPPGWRGTPEGTWGNCVDPEFELMKRVRIKLLSQGVDVRGTSTLNGKIYPNIKGILYVEWDTDNGVRYISGSMGVSEDDDRLSAIKKAKVARGGDDFLTEADIPTDIILINMEEGGVDPYEFLGLTPP